LDLPNVPADGGVGPTLTIHSPLEKQTIPLNAPVSLDADSVNGVASVTVTCGGAPSTGVFTWNVPPYTGVVDFTRCTLVASGVAPRCGFSPAAPGWQAGWRTPAWASCSSPSSA